MVEIPERAGPARFAPAIAKRKTACRRWRTSDRPSRRSYGASPQVLVRSFAAALALTPLGRAHRISFNALPLHTIVLAVCRLVRDPISRLPPRDAAMLASIRRSG